MNVENYYPYEAKYDSPETRAQAGFPDMLRGIKDRFIAQKSFEAWCHTNPSLAARMQERNPQHWQER